MKATKFMTLTLAIITMILSSCSKSENTPQYIVEKSFRNIQKNNFRVALEDYLYFGDEAYQYQMEYVSEMMRGLMEIKKGIETFTFISETPVDDYKTIVTMSVTYGNGTCEEEETIVVKQDGIWKITLE